MQACLEASAEFERLGAGRLELEHHVCWGAACTVLKPEGGRLWFGNGQPGFGWSNREHGDTTKSRSPFHHLLNLVDWFPLTGPEPGFAEERPGFSYTPDPTRVRLWVESDHTGIDTPAGRFADCLLLRVSQTPSPRDAETASRESELNKVWCGEKWCWFARGVGPVAYRSERADGIVEHVLLSKFECPEERDEWVPLVVGTRWEYLPAEPDETLDTLVAEWLTHVDEEGRWYQAHMTIANRRSPAGGA